MVSWQKRMPRENFERKRWRNVVVPKEMLRKGTLAGNRRILGYGECMRSSAQCGIDCRSQSTNVDKLRVIIESSMPYTVTVTPVPYTIMKVTWSLIKNIHKATTAHTT